jgi:predicted molibdopterin-dependent oxidoreductase YjgC
MHAALNEFVRPGLTAGQLGTSWQQKSGYQQLDGLWPLAVAVRAKDLVVSNDPSLMESVLANVARKSERKPLEYFAGFNHQQERANFERFSLLVDHPNVTVNAGRGSEPQFFSGNMASLSATLADVSAERIEIRSDGGKVRQTVTYEWSQ